QPARRCRLWAKLLIQKPYEIPRQAHADWCRAVRTEPLGREALAPLSSLRAMYLNESFLLKSWPRPHHLFPSDLPFVSRFSRNIGIRNEKKKTTRNMNVRST